MTNLTMTGYDWKSPLGASKVSFEFNPNPEDMQRTTGTDFLVQARGTHFWKRARWRRVLTDTLIISGGLPESKIHAFRNDVLTNPGISEPTYGYCWRFSNIPSGCPDIGINDVWIISAPASLKATRLYMLVGGNLEKIYSYSLTMERVGLKTGSSSDSGLGPL